MRRPFQQIDVFATRPFSGNPLAIVMDAEGLSTEEMQRFTRWMNLSETTFLFPPTSPEADYRVRIFTLAQELPFAGHPTLGTCHAWLTSGGVPRDPDRRGMREDPVTGSLNASLAQWLLATGRATAPYVASQGTRLGRSGRLRIEQDADGTVWVGGATTTYISGDLDTERGSSIRMQPPTG